ncbi:TPA: hypothetical protein ACIZB4_002910 [Legionella pneumophila]|uniref:hypothetical protein n=1 Tax=Legionella pneumophila TaxID=446 RepID=UPI0001D202C1|nr:hypothetical protein [Legionella pneumophila]ADG25803.1 hypothetical protein-transmembrane region and signal peptide prediction [Legionella pneumophila 2300/99 Alcoy]ANH13785.1 hypothetical protein A5478_12385 [Legionella pneumophila]ANH16747.1 hypothetical protein A5480_12380 [Legionella pneumophila]ANH19724.1 hypothetical protein A5479_12435 [Legionella pneumophila]APX20601.1 hypothetical protein A1D14_12380 [Legionella pneumophila]
MKIILSILIALHATSTYAGQQVLVLSGGDNPGLNHYTQYLQTKTLYEHLITRFNPETVSIYFGGGNTPTTQPSPFDVHKLINTKDNQQNKEDVMFTGIIANNQQANKYNVDAFFLSSKIQQINPGDNLLLFVSDHGMPHGFLEDKNTNPYSNNCIDLWHYQKPFINNFTNAKNFSKACLSKNELSSLLALIPSQQVIFAMSQCYSGGFHQLSVTTQDGYPVVNTKICGFTSSTDDHYASGCTADANGATYQGYERSFTEWYTGHGVIDGKKIREPAKSMLVAHQNAIIEDMTVDIPLSTSDYYLLQWAKLFASKQFKSRTKHYDNNMIQSIYLNYKKRLQSSNNDALYQFMHVARASEDKIVQLMPEAREFASLSLTKQKQKISSLEKQLEQEGKELQALWEGMMNLTLNVIMPSWEKAVNQSKSQPLNEKQQTFEKEFYQTIVKLNLYQHPYQFEMYYLQYLSEKQNDPDLVNYQKNRNAIIYQWARAHNNDPLANAIKNWEKLNKKQLSLTEHIAEEEKKKQWLKRIFTYNQIIASWVTLLTIHDEKALIDLEGLLKCQNAS